MKDNLNIIWKAVCKQKNRKMYFYSHSFSTLMYSCLLLNCERIEWSGVDCYKCEMVQGIVQKWVCKSYLSSRVKASALSAVTTSISAFSFIGAAGALAFSRICFKKNVSRNISAAMGIVALNTVLIEPR